MMNLVLVYGILASIWFGWDMSKDYSRVNIGHILINGFLGFIFLIGWIWPIYKFCSIRIK